jgi:predicted O-methyltransferase YrrM
MDNRADIFFEALMPSPPEYIVQLEKEALMDEVPIIRKPTRDLLRYLIRTKKPVHILEVGTAVGYSALFMKECVGDSGKIVTIEKVPDRIAKATANFQKYDEKKQISLRPGDATEVLGQLVSEKQSFDFIFMDAAKGQYLNFLPDILRLLEVGGILVTDNTLHGGDVLESRYAVTRRDRTIHGRMREYLHVLTHSEQLESICLALGDGVAISTKVKE